MKNLGFSSMLSKIALNQYLLHNTKKEWGLFIIAIALLKLITWIISIYAGFYYARSIAMEQITNSVFWSAFAAITVLVIIEVATNAALVKYFKFQIRGIGKLKAAIGSLILVFMFFGMSFFISTNGMAMRQTDKVDNTKLIVEKAELNKKTLEKEYQKRINEIDSQIISIKTNPEGWSGHRRIILLPHQNSKIYELYKEKKTVRQDKKKELTTIEETKKHELEANQAHITAEADKYYKMAAWIMLIQFVSSGILMFFWQKIASEDSPEKVVDEKVDNVILLSKELGFNAVDVGFAFVMDAFASRFNKLAVQPKNNLVLNEKKTEEKPEPETEEKPVEEKKQIGFITTEPSRHLNNTADLKQLKSNLDYLKKHKKIVEVIKENNLPKQERLTNQEIKYVSEMAEKKEAKHHSRTLVMKVFDIYNTVGAEHIQINNGEIEII